MWRIDDRDPLVQLHTLCLDSVRKSAPPCASVVSLCGVDVTASTKLVGLPCVVESKGITPFLHSTFNGDHVLFEWGTVESFFDYGVVVAAAVFIGLLYELVIALRRGWEEKWVEELRAEVILPDSIQDTPALDAQETPATDAEAAPLLQGSTTQPSLFQRMRTQIRNRVYVSYVIVTRQVRVRGLRSLLKALEGIALVAVVLLVATFNSVLCLAVVAGLAAGAFLFT
ncbi:hypothetical protein BCR33DRAFT_442527 [Rhizoclosmatium globosum]|uniref:Copper transport protein n=1 Tax=Rhizoclosmatium globosum TaxID=329046 RepID=A0A1Y2BV66_9FUNG|nr:hypothetical protein BCR33DRAFT_442527 [Rhizoclosmatium globosum]|eukprot:ORY37985.1 hypothetical protein BCR33DRAFT_442527 [Rhizoclosmatium globosum]